jgi:hypothetical protein
VKVRRVRSYRLNYESNSSDVGASTNAEGLHPMLVLFELRHLEIVDGEPRIAVRDLAQRLGISLDMIRDIIRDAEDAIFKVPIWKKSKPRGGCPSTDLYVDEAFARWIAAEAKTPKSDAVIRAIGAVFDEWRKGQTNVGKHFDRMK